MDTNEASEFRHEGTSTRTEGNLKVEVFPSLTQIKLNVRVEEGTKTSFVIYK